MDMPPPHSAQENKGKIYDTIGGGHWGRTDKAAPDDRFPKGGFDETIEESLKELLAGIGGYEARIVASPVGEWTVHLVLPRQEALASWNGYLSSARTEKSRKEEEMAGYLEQFKALPAIAAHLQLLRKSGPVKEYRRAEKELEGLSKNVADLEARVKELGTYGYWVQEFPSGKYAVYPYPSVMEVTTSYSSGVISSPKLNILFNPQLKGKDMALFHELGLNLGKSIQKEWPWVGVHLGFSKSAMLYTIPLADARAEEAAARKELEKKPAEKKPKGRTTWP